MAQKKAHALRHKCRARSMQLNASPRHSNHSLVVCADGHEAGVFSRGTGVGLQADCIKARDGAELHAQVLEHLVVALSLVLQVASWAQESVLGTACAVSLVLLSAALAALPWAQRGACWPALAM